MIKASVKKNKDNGDNVGKLLLEISKMQVYVGIPEEESSRESGDITNAQLLYIHTHGSNLKNIPPRPVIEPAIEAEDNKNQITDELQKAVQSLLDSNPTQAEKHLQRSGMIGQNAARDWFEDPRNNWAPNTERTAIVKLQSLKGKKKLEFNRRISAGESVTDISRPLIDTAQMRKSIVYVVKKNG